MIGYRLDWGIWNKEHSITSRDVGDPEIRATKQELENIIKEKAKYFASKNYEIWFYDIKEIEVEMCACEKLKEVDCFCYFCGAGWEGS